MPLKLLPMQARRGLGVQLHLLVLAALSAGAASVQAQPSGEVEFTRGVGYAQTPGQGARILGKGLAFREGDTLSTGAYSSAQIKMQDGGFIALRPDSRLKFDKFSFNGQQDGSESSYFSLIKGGFRAVTGLIGQLHKPAYRIKTPTATLGIRGTDHETYVVTTNSPLAATVPAGTYNKVNVGETSITTEKGSIAVLPNQMGYAGAADQLPQLLPLNLNIFTVIAAPPAHAKTVATEENMRAVAVVDYAMQVRPLQLNNSLPAERNLILFPISVSVSGLFTTPIVFTF